MPEDFPRARHLGAVAGAQPKLVLREVAGRFTANFTEEELAHSLRAKGWDLTDLELDWLVSQLPQLLALGQRAT